MDDISDGKRYLILHSSLFRQEEETHGQDGPLASDRSVREKLAIASAETYKMLRADMSEIIKTSDWRRARGVGFTDVRSLRRRCWPLSLLTPSFRKFHPR